MSKRNETRIDKCLAFIGLSLLVAFFLSGPLALAQYGEHVDVITVNGVIDPFTAQYVGRGLDIAQGDGAQCLIIQLDTPGGSDTPMRAIVQKMLNSSVPIVVYVSPGEPGQVPQGFSSPWPPTSRPWPPALTSGPPTPWPCLERS